MISNYQNRMAHRHLSFLFAAASSKTVYCKLRYLFLVCAAPCAASTTLPPLQSYLCHDQRSIRLHKISHRPCSLRILGSYSVQARSARHRSTAGHWSLATQRYHLHALCRTRGYMNYSVMKTTSNISPRRTQRHEVGKSEVEFRNSNSALYRE
jgi:hypothetical protein